ncbi:hypothetical protein J6590_061125 [Homalodisca vitripennis]|nr:hypothetical protein J6590_061125 [Homalodisca vitripennis]
MKVTSPRQVRLGAGGGNHIRLPSHYRWRWRRGCGDDPICHRDAGVGRAGSLGGHCLWKPARLMDAIPGETKTKTQQKMNLRVFYETNRRERMDSYARTPDHKSEGLCGGESRGRVNFDASGNRCRVCPATGNMCQVSPGGHPFRELCLLTVSFCPSGITPALINMTASTQLLFALEYFRPDFAI